MAESVTADATPPEGTTVDPFKVGPSEVRGPGQSAVVGWIVAIVGCAAVAGWIHWSPPISELVPMPTIALAATAFYLVLFAPLIALGALLGWTTGIRTLAPGRNLAVWLPGALGAGGVGILATIGFAWLNGRFVTETGLPAASGLIMVGLALTLVQVGGEEVVFRGWLQPLLGRLAGAWVGLFLTSALFAAMHLLGGSMPLHALGNVFLAGIFFGLLAMRTGGIAAPVAAHFMWNAIEDLGFGLIPNPGVGPFGAVHNVAIGGSAIWGGGPEGLNASIGTTIALLALILPLLALRSREARV